MRVLVVEDDSGISHGLNLTLGQQGWAVDAVSDLAKAWSALRSEPFDVVLLDLGLPDGDGATLLTRLRHAPAGGHPDPGTPVLIMTARDQVEERIHALDLGADDYLTKPFDAWELSARIRAVRRRYTGRSHPVIRRGNLELDPATRQVRLDGATQDLSVREFGVLQALLEVSPRVLSRQQIEASLYRWDQALESNAIEVHVHHLRKKLGEGIIQTLRGVGYFIPEDRGR